jgi:hypothetical protein
MTDYPPKSISELYESADPVQPDQLLDSFEYHTATPKDIIAQRVIRLAERTTLTLPQLYKLRDLAIQGSRAEFKDVMPDLSVRDRNGIVAQYIDIINYAQVVIEQQTE